MIRNMRYFLVRKNWENADTTLKLDKKTYPAASCDEWQPPKNERLGEITSRKAKKDAKDIVVGLHQYALHPMHNKRRFFVRRKGWVQVQESNGTVAGYVLVTGMRKSAVIATVCIALTAGVAALSLTTGVAPQNLPIIFADQTGITNNNKDAHAEIGSYSAYASVPDQTWKAGETKQDVSLSLPATVTHTDKEGKDKTDDNPIYAAPHIYVDLNKDGEFTEDECVYNPMQYDSNGNVTNIGALLKPGNEVKSIQLTKAIDAGEYDAELLWTGITIESHEMANPMTFKFGLTVQ